MIEKINYRDQVRKLLLLKMRSGSLKPNQTISLAALARELDVSVTPIREALSQLQSSEIIEAIPNRGFIIPQLTKHEAKNLYELIACLEELAILNSDYTPSSIKKLEKLNSKFEKTDLGIDRINADINFHEGLTAIYNNPRAQQILSELKTRIFFYEVDFMENNEFYEQSSNHHIQIIECLKSNKKSEACMYLKQNWMQILNHN